MKKVEEITDEARERIVSRRMGKNPHRRLEICIRFTVSECDTSMGANENAS